MKARRVLSPLSHRGRGWRAQASRVRVAPSPFLDRGGIRLVPARPAAHDAGQAARPSASGRRAILRNQEDRMIDIERRALLAALPLAVVLADPKLAAAAAAELETVTITTKGGRKVSGTLAEPGHKAPAVLLIHEWWGLNDQIKSVAAELAKQGYL